MYPGVFEFYKGRISSCPSYGFKSGHEILKTIMRCAFWDSFLTLSEFNSIINLCEQAHIKMMEEIIMQDGQRMSKTRKGDREIISVSLPLEVYDKMQELCDHYNINRSSMVATAIANYLRDFGIKVGER